ncbi:MAG: hypothetical protein WBW08_09935 [Methyloceanibacter sp.]
MEVDAFWSGGEHRVTRLNRPHFGAERRADGLILEVHVSRNAITYRVEAEQLGEIDPLHVCVPLCRAASYHEGLTEETLALDDTGASRGRN